MLEWFNQKIDYFYSKIAYVLPKGLIYWASVRLMAHGTSGEYRYTNASNVRIITLLRRWEKDNG